MPPKLTSNCLNMRMKKHHLPDSGSLPGALIQTGPPFPAKNFSTTALVAPQSRPSRWMSRPNDGTGNYFLGISGSKTHTILTYVTYKSVKK